MEAFCDPAGLFGERERRLVAELGRGHDTPPPLRGLYRRVRCGEQPRIPTTPLRPSPGS